ncbi:hypothetical protein [Sphingomonas beigongshangi]|uniref:hypothetical protein n=1 Tax=Sphingomonas beigongshangi TaxID=2782540 RepID=UPI001AEE92B3|nr:hypothetical protein [Sphingomonas beigongshangi]
MTAQRHAILITLALVTSACAAAPAIDGPVGVGQTAVVGGLHVRPDRVIEDSRCPVGVTCVWAGRVILRATVSDGSWSKPINLILGVPADVADGKLTLVSVTPARKKGETARTTSSRFAFKFQDGRQ